MLAARQSILPIASSFQLTGYLTGGGICRHILSIDIHDDSENLLIEHL